MKKKITSLFLVAALGSLVISSYVTGPAHNGYDCTGAETGGTGTYANPTGCSAGSGCHSTRATTTIGVGIVLDSAGVPTTHYVGGMTYTVSITGTPTGTTNTHYGFQLNALVDTVSTMSNVSAGTWSGTGLPTGTQRSAAISPYTKLTTMEHNTVLALSGSSFTQSFVWTAPATGTGAISFWGAANFVNDNDTADAADVWNTNHVVIHEWASTEFTQQEVALANVTAFPNPVSKTLNLQFGNAATGNYQLNIFDMTGHMVMSQNIEANSAMPTVIATNNWMPGMYQLVLEKNGATKVIQISKQ